MIYLVIISMRHLILYIKSQDLSMKKGIAIRFVEKFDKISELKKQNKKVGEIAYLKVKNRFIIYLITKSKFSEKPKYEIVFNVFVRVKKFCLIHNLKKLAMPRIASGLDKFKWQTISNMINYIFYDTKVNILIFSFY